jgi:hypothetical protein
MLRSFVPGCNVLVNGSSRFPGRDGEDIPW